MRKIRFLILALVLLSNGCARMQKPDSSGQNRHAELGSFKKNERILILAPHPDDESIACAGIIQKALKAGARIRVVYLTNGDHNEFAFIVYEKRITMRQGEFIYLGKLRQKESIKAMKFLGLSEKDLVFLGYPDYGTFEIFCKYWQAKKPFRDRLTRISSVPYKDNFSYGAKYYGENILSDLTKQILDYQPDKIFVSHPADVNVDHKALYLFLQVALSDLEGRMAKPEIYPYLVHCAGWPRPRHYHPELELYPPDKFIGSKLNWLRSNLSPEELDKKYRSILFYKSQTQSSAFYLFSFARKNELFSDYPPVELKPQSASGGKDIVYSDASEMFKEEERPIDSKQIESLEDKGSVSYAARGNYFIARLDKPKKLSSRFGVMLYIFGYSQSTPFAQMPKIRIITMGKSCKVFSSKNRVIDPGVLVDFGRNSLIIKIPLKLLGQPDYTLTALKAYHGNLPLDVVVFRKVKIK
ncbi:MAG: PIG-L family deacetylase [Candidatus Omnitrophica bacterium]|nr:PIG-L family deacetylase [Candidatus Omnitrophota bacterium]